MNKKILIADDSPTINKVIRIILANESCELIDCPKESELLDKVLALVPSIVLLDFTLSESKSGYELSKKIVELSPASKVIILYGTFDTVDEIALKNAHSNGHIVKPFDSNKFLTVFRKLLEDKQMVSDDSAILSEAKSENEETSFVTDSKNEMEEVTGKWTLNESFSNKEEISQKQTEKLNLNDALNDWGIDVPGVIGSREKKTEKPPLIDKSEDFLAQQFKPTEKEVKSLSKGLSSKLISINELNLETENTTSSLQLAGVLGMEDDGLKLIEEKIKDEINDNFWKADEIVDFKVSAKELKIDLDKTSSFQTVPKAQKNEKIDTFSEESKNIDVNYNSDEFKHLIKSIAREVLEDLFKEKIDRIAWEVIPDLAENLIKKEIGQITSKLKQN